MLNPPPRLVPPSYANLPVKPQAPPTRVLADLENMMSANNRAYGFSMHDPKGLVPELAQRMTQQLAGPPQAAAWAGANALRELQQAASKGLFGANAQTGVLHSMRNALDNASRTTVKAYDHFDPGLVSKTLQTLWAENAMKARHYLKSLNQ